MAIQLQTTHNAPKLGRVQHSITMLMGMWLIVGVFIDGFAHNHGVVETFFTPWHAILYSGYLACAAWIFWLTYKNKAAHPAAGWKAAIPIGYWLGVVGVVVFFIGGIGDMIWHTVFGIEKNIEALLSPTHLILLSGALLILTSPYRALSVTEADEPTFRQLLPALTSIALTFATMAFFLMYAWSFRQNLWMAREEDAVARAVVDFLITTMLLVVPVMVMLRRWKLPFGAVTFIFVFEGALMAILDGFRHYGAVVILLISGIVGDLLFRSIREKQVGSWPYSGVFFLLPIVIWGLYFIGVNLSDDLHWAPELWGGAMFLSGLASMGLSILASPVGRGTK